MHVFKVFLAFIGRALIGSVFLYSAIENVLNWQEIERNFVAVLCDWHAYASFSYGLQNFFSELLAFVPLLLVFATLAEFIGSLSLIFGIKARFGAFLLLFFLLSSTLLFHPFWFLEGAKRELHFVLFLKNIAIIGCFFHILSFGTKLSKDFLPSLPIEE